MYEWSFCSSMDVLYATKQNDSELYFQIENSASRWNFLDELAHALFDDNWMIDDHYRGQERQNDYFSYTHQSVTLLIISADGRSHIIVQGFENSQLIIDLVFRYFAFKSES